MKLKNKLPLNQLLGFNNLDFSDLTERNSKKGDCSDKPLLELISRSNNKIGETKT